MLHQGQRLPLSFKPSDDLPAVHARLDDLDRDFAFDRISLLSNEHQPEAAFSESFQQPIRADPFRLGFAEPIVERSGDLHFVQAALEVVLPRLTDCFEQSSEKSLVTAAKLSRGVSALFNREREQSVDPLIQRGGAVV